MAVLLDFIRIGMLVIRQNGLTLKALLDLPIMA